MSVNLFQTTFPPQITPIVDEKGTVTIPWMGFLRALFQRTGEGTGTPFSADNNLVATGATQGTALALKADWNNITGGGGAGVILPAMTLGQSIVFFNNAGGNINVYPPIGGQLTVLGVTTPLNAPYVSTAPDAVIFYFFSNTAIIGI